VKKSNDHHPNRRATKMLDHIRRRANRLGYEFDLNREWILKALNQGKCSVTGIKFDFQLGNGADVRNKFAPSIDRLDSSKGYTTDNCRVVIYQYNVAKGIWTDSDVLVMAQALIENQSDENNTVIC
jgi:hypothetical protein